jgi:hydrogenase-4 component F
MTQMPVAGTIMLLAALAIAGTPPFNIFLSEFIILKAAADQGSWTTLAFFIIFATIIFGGVLHHFGSMAFGKAENAVSQKEGTAVSLVLVAMSAVMLLCGLSIPAFLGELLHNSVKVILGV